MEKVILIKYGELTTKKANRNLFINIITDNIRAALSNYDVNIEKNRVRMFITTSPSSFDEVLSILQNIFGIHSIVVAYKVNTNIDTIYSSVLEVASSVDFSTFKVETDRADKSFPISSPDFSRNIGAHILKNIPGKKVDVHTPDYLLRLEIRHDYTYIYSKEIKGSGGYPLGVAGKGLLMLSGGIDSPVAGYLAMKRGIKLECIYFESPPHTTPAAKNKVQPSIRLHVINFTKIQEAIYKNIDPTYMITIMRRMMYRITEKVLRERKCYVIINGESVGQVASQTLTSMQVINNVTNLPVIRPAACFDKLEIIDISRKIGTYETSILPYEDCCTIFLPKHPVINPDLSTAIKYENSFDYATLIEEAVNTRETIVIDNNFKKFDI